jgi:hypothetical protein
VGGDIDRRIVRQRHRAQDIVEAAGGVGEDAFHFVLHISSLFVIPAKAGTRSGLVRLVASLAQIFARDDRVPAFAGMT